MGLILKPANSIFGVGAHPGRHLSDLPPKHQFAAEFCWFGAGTPGKNRLDFRREQSGSVGARRHEALLPRRLRATAGSCW
jgi:hypothetical protein